MAAFGTKVWEKTSVFVLHARNSGKTPFLASQFYLPGQKILDGLR